MYKLEYESRDQWLPVGELYRAMKAAGSLWYGRSALHRREFEGRLTLPRDHKGNRIVTPAMIEEIIEAFSPEGKGEWHYNEK